MKIDPSRFDEPIIPHTDGKIHQVKTISHGLATVAYCGAVGVYDHMSDEVTCEGCAAAIRARRAKLFGVPPPQPLPHFVPGPRKRRA